MITFTRNTLHEIELTATSAKELKSFVSALKNADKDIEVQICQNSNLDGLARFPIGCKALPKLPPVGSTWNTES